MAEELHFDDPAAAAQDPSTDAEALRQLAYRYPELRPAVAAHPHAYRGLLDWLHQFNDPQVNAALEARAQQVRQAARVGTRGVQAYAKAKLTHARHRRTERDLAGRLAAGKHDAVEEATPARQQILERAPRDNARDARVDNRTVVAVRARPRAPLQEQGRREFPRPVHGRHRHEAGDLQVVRRPLARSPPPDEAGDAQAQRALPGRPGLVVMGTGAHVSGSPREGTR